MADIATTSNSSPVEVNPSMSSAVINDSQPNESSTQPTHPALATSKRKFHKLLENITKPTNTKRSLDTIFSSTDSPAKRIRLEARARLEANGPAGEVVGVHIQSQLLRARLEAARTTSPKDTTGDKKEAPRQPNYVPWSQESFLQRLKTFADVRLWTSKPDPVNEVAWAKRGWVCVGVNTVACKGGCEQRVVVGLRPSRKDNEGKEIENSEDYELEVDEELVKRVEELIIQGHEDGCLWRDAGCKDNIYHLSIARPTVWQPQLRERYSSLAAISTSLPSASVLQHPFDVQEIADTLPPELLVLGTRPILSTNSAQGTTSRDSTDTPVHTLNHTALAFALLGWTGYHETPSYALATCEACFRRLGLWLYMSETGPNQNVNDDNLEDVSGNKNQMSLDLRNNHRDYCPWVNGSSQAMPGSMAGLPAFEVLQKCIANDAGFRGVGGRSTQYGIGNEDADVTAATQLQSLAPQARSKEDMENEDKARFARLKELSKLIRSKGMSLKSKLGRGKTGDQSRPSSAGLARLSDDTLC